MKAICGPVDVHKLQICIEDRILRPLSKLLLLNATCDWNRRRVIRRTERK